MMNTFRPFEMSASIFEHDKKKNFNDLLLSVDFYNENHGQ